MDQPGNDRDDAWAVERTLLGDRTAFALLVRRYQGPVFRLMLRFVHNECQARDMAQDAFVRAFERLGSYDRERRFFSWLYTLAINLARDHARRVRREPVEHNGEDRLPADPRGDPLASLEAGVLFDVLRGLPPKYREVLALRFIEDLPLASVAELLGLSMSGVKMRVHRGLRLLRERLREDI